MKESKEMVRKEMALMVKGGAKKTKAGRDVLKHEMEEMKSKGKGVKKYARGGGIESKGKTRGKMC